MTEEQIKASFGLELDQIGVFGEVYVNENFVGSTDNLYRTFFIDLEDWVVKVGENTLRIDIQSTVRKTFLLSAKHNTTDAHETRSWL